MSTAAHINEPMVQVDRVHGPRLVGMWQKAVIGAWALVWLVSLVIFLLAIYYWFLWDSTPAAQIPQFFPTITPADQNSLLGYQEAIRQAGLSLVLYGGLFAVLRLISGLPYFVLSTLIVRRRSDRLMVVLFAIVLVVIGTAGRWISANWNALPDVFPWSIIVKILGFLLDCSAIILYAFPDGRFVPRWTRLAAITILILSFSANILKDTAFKHKHARAVGIST